MSREERKLRKMCEVQASREQRKANQALAKIRKAGEAKPPRQRMGADLDWDLDDMGPETEAPPARRKSRSQPENETLVAGLAVETGAGYCDVLSVGQTVRCRAQLDVAVGDRVFFNARKHRVESIQPRSTALTRPDPHNPKLARVIAANIDVVAIVVSLHNPPLRAGLIDRYLIAVEKSGAAPLVCVNKVDLLESDADLEPLDAYRELGIGVILCSALTGLGLDLVAGAVAGKVCVLSGHSGVGKSSLLNALDPALELATAEVSAAHHTGRHTTTSSTLHRLPNGAVLIDTPGIREFGLWDIDAADARRAFHEFDEFRGGCAFADCSHTHEPDCAVRLALERGELPAPRYAAYRRILDSLSGA